MSAGLRGMCMAFPMAVRLFAAMALPTVLAMALAMVLAMASGAAAQVGLGNLDFCVRPVAPPCVDRADTYRRPALQKRCDAEMERFIKMAFTYRVCLGKQLENVIRDTNAVNDRFKCRKRGDKDCD